MPLDAAPQPSGPGVEAPAGPLYATRVRVYPKSVRGLFRQIKWGILAVCLGLYYIAPWIRWDRGPGAPDQALLIDLPGRRAYFFAIEIWPQEVYYLTGLLILGAIGLFLITSLLGRVWCGYACPQTVWTDLFMLVERWIEGDRNARMRLDERPMSIAKAGRKALKHGVWLLIAAATGGAWVLYFVDAPTAFSEIFTGHASAETYFFIGLFTTTTYLLAGWAREQVCTYMCPWPRFQAAMFDENTLIVTYQAWRGEPRGKHKAGQSWEGRGDCVDCQQCVMVCPTGIDIRDGQQLECIGCGLCIDACNGIMDKVGRPRQLIKFDTFSNQAARAAGRPTVYRLLRPRVILYAGLLGLVSSIMLFAFVIRPTVEVNVLRDRTPLFVTLSDGAIRNGYTLKILNKTHESRQYALTLSGVPGATVNVVGAAEPGGPESGLVLPTKADAVATYRVFVTAPRASLTSDSMPLVLYLREIKAGTKAEYHSVFLGPG